ncbi:phosphotransferase family protein [Paenibacillus sp. J22TS3]|uniref:phosphotransferase family protein n=1 Tax=Paenibacillus sp. J22TS3 TaxID=2807192 RepID=UPI001B01292C|nr:aminoglycoside phosphotransferase family protein [Paenibacillus sp. J22TS3]GIP22176.1 aminoglycoside phosphotransferase [Paenibacillus sp. J22TS3]
MDKISEGRTAEVFAQGQDKILKLYRNGFPMEAVKYEYEVNRIVALLGIPAPRAYDLMDFDHKKGIVFERIEGSTLLRRCVQSPNELHHLTREFADLHDRIHKYELDLEHIEGSPVFHQKVVLAQNIQNAPHLSEEVKEAIIDYLKSLPDGNRLCHGDFHPENVLIGERNWVIDWMTGMIGNPAGDVARTLLLFRFGMMPDEAPHRVKEAFEQMRETISEVYLEQYLSSSGLQRNDIDEWMLPIAAARLSEWIPDEEKDHLLNFMEKRMK